MRKWIRMIGFALGFAIGSMLLINYARTCLYAQNLNRFIENNDMDSLSVWLNKHGNLDSKPYVLDLGRTNFPPLTFAAYVGNTEAVQILLDHGADVNNTDGTNGTSPMLASLSRAYAYNPNRILIAEMLIESGADIHYRDREGRGDNALSAVLVPSTSEDKETEKASQLSFVIFLIGLGVDYSIDCAYGSVLSKAAAYDNHLVVEYLIQQLGQNVNQPNAMLNTPLMIAILNGSEYAVSSLLNLNADQTIMNSEGKTAWNLAVEIGNTAIINLLDDPDD